MVQSTAVVLDLIADDKFPNILPVEIFVSANSDHVQNRSDMEPEACTIIYSLKARSVLYLNLN